MACLHRARHVKFEGKAAAGKEMAAQTSPLVFKMDFNATNPLFSYKYLLGTGYQYQWDVFLTTDNKGHRVVNGLIVYMLGAYLLDFLAIKNTKKKESVTSEM